MLGKTISHYKIIEKLGEGGMGEVYLAEDSRLDRKVALKILPQHLSDRAELRERFEREARAVSSLNHPHICTLYDIGEQDGIHYLVMEHLVGETLEARLAKGALPLEQTLEYAIQIADALDKAHRQGVVHRDLKPGNIMLVKSGAKLLDFGLAKLQAAETPTNLSALPTEQANLTAEGTILGTLQYMAPEQLEAKEADSRTDIFAFGATVYEMATGKKAFEGKSQASLIGAILKDDPAPMAELQPMTPSFLDRVVKKCLAKEPDERWQTATDLLTGLRWVTEVEASIDSLPAVAAPAVWKRAVPWSIAAAFALVVAAVAFWSPFRPTPTTIEPQRLVVSLPENLRPSGPAESWSIPVAISPDGTQIVYAALQGGQSQLYRRPMGDFEAEPIPRTEGATSPFFSHDGQSIGFFEGGKFQKLLITGNGLPDTIADAPTYSGTGVDWGADGRIIFATSTFGVGLSLIPAGGGSPELLTTPNLAQGERMHFWPQFLPDGKHVLFTVWGEVGSRGAAILSLDTLQWEIILPEAHGSRFLPTGHILFFFEQNAGEGRLEAVPFDSESLRILGNSVTVLEGVDDPPRSGRASAAVSNTGTLLYVPKDPRQRMLVWVDREGNPTPITDEPGPYEFPRISSGGERVVFGEERHAVIYDLNRGVRTHVRAEVGSNFLPIWTPDGSRVTFANDKTGFWDLYYKSADGIGQAEPLLQNETSNFPMDWSSHRQTLVFTELHPKTGVDIWILPPDGNPLRFLATEFHEDQPRFSPDGNWLAYVSNRSSRKEVYVQGYPTGSARTVSTNGGAEPVWSRDGRELFYRQGDLMWVVEFDTSSGEPGAPRMLFEREYEADIWTNYDISPDGDSFLMILPDANAPHELRVILNWFEELKRLVPTDN